MNLLLPSGGMDAMAARVTCPSAIQSDQRKIPWTVAAVVTISAALPTETIALHAIRRCSPVSKRPNVAPGTWIASLPRSPWQSSSRTEKDAVEQ